MWLIFQFNMLKIFNTGAELATHNCCFRLFFLDNKCIYVDAEHLYDHIKRETFQTRLH